MFFIVYINFFLTFFIFFFFFSSHQKTAAVNGGIANFIPFLDGSFEQDNPEIYEDIQAHPEKQELVNALRAHIAEHLIVLKRGVDVHARVCHENMLPLHEIIIKKFPALVELITSISSESTE